MNTKEYIKIKVDNLQKYAVAVLTKLGVPQEDAQIIAKVLIASDQRGIESHGFQRMKFYVNGITSGMMKPITEMKIIKETPNTLLVSGGDGMGMVTSYKTMKLVIDKALNNNLAFATVRDSNHYGIAGYYSMMALEHDLIGFSGTNTALLMVPTHGRRAIIGTNPIAIAAPSGKELPFVLDMATTTVSRGKLEVYSRENTPMPDTWATDELGRPTQDIERVLSNFLERKGGGLLPLGGAGEISGGHKGYGLCLAIDILSGVLSGGSFGPQLYSKKNAPSKVCHFFGAINISAFHEPKFFKNMMDEYINILKNSEKAPGQDRIYVHGEKEFELAEKQKDEISMYHGLVKELENIGNVYGVKLLH